MDVLEQHDLKNIEDIAFEYGRVMDWFNDKFPEGTIRLDVNNDKTTDLLIYNLSVMTGKEATDNQGFFQSVIKIDRTRFENPVWMDNFKAGIYPRYTKSIERAYNRHYNIEKEKTLAKN